ncbi:ATP-binding protein [Actinophytocola sp.]|uniref:ATP-binding protein n=1 Tax=Actinophytocola sp. TaxID=1872138 RepID=UPI002ED6AB88
MIADRVSLRGIENLSAALSALVGRLAAAAGLDSAQAYRLRLAAEEIAVNVATHGYGDGDGEILIDAGLDDEWVWLRLTDRSPEFDPTEHDPDPRLTADPDVGPSGGFGLFLALSSVDRFEHEYVGGRNRNKLLIRRRAGGDGGD